MARLATLMLSLIADLTHPDQVQTVDITWANSQELCVSFIDRSWREAWLVRGDLDACGTHEPVPLLTPSSAQERATSETSPVIKDGVKYLYVPEGPIYFDQMTALPPMPGTESGDFDGAIKEAWRHALVRQNADGTYSCECEFVTRRLWFNLAI